MTGVSIREAKRTDAKKIFELMQQSIVEQNAVLPPHLTHKVVEEDGWGPAAVFLVFVAEKAGGTPGQLDGYVLAHRAYSTWEGRSLFIKDVFVVPLDRRRGVATQLCQRVLQAALRESCTRCDVLLDATNTAGVGLFEKLGAHNLTVAEEWHYFSMDSQAIAEMRTSCEDQGPPKVRRASPEDMKGVMAMIQELANYERMPHGPKIDSCTLVADASPPGTFFECFVAESQGALAAYLLLYHTFSCSGRGIYMEDLYVRPQYRQQGLGTSLMAHAAQRCLDVGASHLQFSVLAWNTPSIAFYQQKGATDLTASKSFHVYRFLEADIRKHI